MKLYLFVFPLLVLAAPLCPGGGLTWHSDGGARWADLPRQSSGSPAFTLLSPETTGVTFKNTLTDSEGAANRVLYNGSGVALGDFNNDGLPDAYFCSLAGRNALYRNLGNWQFEEVAAQAGVECYGEVCRGAVFADLEGDGDLDLLVSTNGRGVLCFLNDGHGKFSDATRSADTASDRGSVTLALADVDGNGTLDLYVANNRKEDFRDKGQVQLQMLNGKMIVPPWYKDRFRMEEGELQEYGEPDIVYLNDGKGHLTPLSWTGGAFLDEDGQPLSEAPRDWALTVTFRDLNGDGGPDIYVCNDYWTPDRIWMNDGQGRFRASPRLGMRSISASSMGVDFADLTREGRVDCMVVDMLSRSHTQRMIQAPAQSPAALPLGESENRPQILRNTLHHGRSDGTFAEIANFSGLPASEWAWQPIFLDVDLDGFEDVLIATGHVRDVQDLDTSERIKQLQREGRLVPPSTSLGGFGQARTRQEQFTAELLQMAMMRPRLDTPIVAFRNRGDLRFEEKTEEWGLNTPGVHHGMALADLDGDGDLDVVVNNLNAPAGVYRNEASAPRVAVRLRGASPNTQGIGAKIKLLGGAVPMQSQEVVCGGRYLSGCDPMLVFAAGKASAGMTLEVKWRSGQTSTVREVKANRLYEIEESGAEAAGEKKGERPKTKDAAPETPMFADVSAGLAHAHHENEFDDFAREPLLPNRLSRLGPGVAWHDVDGDGRADLVAGSGKDGRMAVLLSDGKGGFARREADALAQPLERDASGLALWSESPGKVSLLAGSANFEDGKSAGEAARQFEFEKGKAQLGAGLPGGGASSGPLALGDLEGRGQLAAFVGGRVIPGQYPAPAASRLFRRANGQWVLDEKSSALFAKLGLATGALFTDLNGDGFGDLVVTLEWGPVSVFLNDGQGALRNATEQLGFAKMNGWWNGVAAGDFNEDGRLDLVAANWGLNSKYEHAYDAAHPLQIVYGDFNGDGVTQIVECHYDAKLGKVVPERMRNSLAAAMPWIAQAMPTHAAYGAASIQEILGERLQRATTVSAHTLAHTLFLNKGAHFEAVALPREAQFAPGFGVCVADFDGDGHEDVFLAQNFFAAQPETPRIDAGRGLLLHGDGKGALVPVPGQVSGIQVYGDARGCAVADYDGDGRTDLAVTQNGAATKLYRNLRARPGLRVRLSGPPGNLDGLGAQVRLIFGKRHGPVRELHAGSGYWSQDSAIPVLGTPAPPTQIWVRWPGGKVTTSKISGGAKEVSVSAPSR